MNTQVENEQNALIDALKYTTDVVSALSVKINIQDEEINCLKNKLILIEEQLKINYKLYYQEPQVINKTPLNEYNSEEDTNTKSKNFEITSVRQSEIDKLKKEKVGSIVEKLIKKKNEINEIIKEKINNEETKFDNNEKIEQEIKKPEITIARRKNRLMRKF